MNIEVGQWYRCRNENFLAHVVGTIVSSKWSFAAAFYKDGSFHSVNNISSKGTYFDIEGGGLDLIEHLPDCTGPDWTPRKWRKAKPEDAVRYKECRIGNFQTVIHGFRARDGRISFYCMDDCQKYSWVLSDCVEVLDD